MPTDEFAAYRRAPAGGGESDEFAAYKRAPVSSDETAPGAAATALEHLGHGASFGFGDELAGVGGAITDAVTGNVAPGGLVQSYRDARDFSRGRLERGAAAHSVAAGAGELSGIVASAGAAPASAVLGGAAAGLGNSAADLTRGEVSQAFGDTALGAATGGVLGAVARGAGALAAPVSRVAGQAAAQFGERAAQRLTDLTGARGAAAANAVGGAGRLADLGIAGRAEGLLRPLRDSLPFSGLAERAGAALRESGAALGALRDQASAKGGTVPLADARSALLADLAPLQEWPSMNSALIAKANGLLNDLAGKADAAGNLTANTLQALKGQVKDLAGAWVREGADATRAQALRSALYGTTERLQRSAIDEALGEDALTDYTAQSARYGTAKGIAKLSALGERGATNATRPFGGLDSLVAGGVGGAAMGHPGAVAGYLGYRALRSPGMQAAGLNVGATIAAGVQRALGSPQFASVLQSAAARGPQALAAAHYVLSASNPDYRDATRDPQGR